MRLAMSFHHLCASLLAITLAARTAEASNVAAAPSAASDATVQPYVIAQTHRMASQVMGETRVLNVMLPSGYGEDPSQR